MENEQSALIVRAVLSLARRLRAQRPAGAVSLAGIGILSTLWREGPMPAVRLAAEEGLQPQSLTRLIGALEQAGLIDRRPSSTDGREIVISISERGTEVLSTDLRERSRWLDEASSAVLNEQERQTLVTATEAMIKLAAHDGAATVVRPPENAVYHRGETAPRSHHSVTK